MKHKVFGELCCDVGEGIRRFQVADLAPMLIAKGLLE
jgi:hypothetical protein